MNAKERLALRQELESLVIDFWHEVDFHGGGQAHTFYVEDAVFTTSIRTRQGRQAIHDFYHARQQRGARTSLHVVQNFRIDAIHGDLVDTSYIMSLYAADGEGVLPSRPAIMIAHCTETVQRQPDGRWLYTSRVLKPLFRDNTPTTG